MKFDIKKLYHSTVKQLEKHQVEIEIALAALALVVFAPESAEEKQAHQELADMYQTILTTIKLQIDKLKVLGG